jgi:hypothetical protein
VACEINQNALRVYMYNKGYGLGETLSCYRGQGSLQLQVGAQPCPRMHRCGQAEAWAAGMR